MSYNPASNAYRSTNIRTASQGNLVVLLYEGAVKNLEMAIKLFDLNNKIKPQNIELFNKYLQKVQAIITELQVSLDMEKGGEIAQNLMALYIYFNNELMSANINHERKKIDFVLNMMKELLNAWRKAASSTANAPATTVANSLNIEG